jgi:hypothetical protein
LDTNRLQVASRTSFLMILNRSGSIFHDFRFFWVLFSAKYFSYLSKDVVVFRHPFLFLDSTFGEGNPERTRIRTGSDGIRNRCRILSESEFRIRIPNPVRIRIPNLNSESGPNPVRILSESEFRIHNIGLGSKIGPKREPKECRSVHF